MRQKVMGLIRRPPLNTLRAKLIIPYVLLTLLTAMVGTYVVTRLVASSVRERFVNQLHEASRVAADAIIRRERAHLADLRLMVFTEGVAQALIDRDAAALQSLLGPLALNNNVDTLTAFDQAGREIVTLHRGQVASQGGDVSHVGPVADVLRGRRDELGDKFVGLWPTANGPYFVTTAPIRDQTGQLVGGLMIGTHLETLLAELKSQTLADIVVLDSDGKLQATTLVKPEGGYGGLELAPNDLPHFAATPPRDLRLYGRDFQVIYAPLVVRQEAMGVLGVVLPSSYVVSTETTGRNTFSVIFALGTAAIILVGFLLSQNIARPIGRLREMSQAVAAGDLTQSTGLTGEDEIGELASAFDTMTQRLRQRTTEAECLYVETARLYAEAIQRNKELAETNARLRAAQQQLIQSEKLAAIGQLTAGIVHDVRNPLTIIKALSELLQKEDGLASTIHEQIDAIHSSAARANTIVGDLLKFARQSAPEFRCGDLRDTVAVALRLTSYLAREAHIQVLADLPQTPLTISYDAQQIEQVLINLIQNAIQAMPNGGTLRVNLDHRPGAVAVAVQDTGVGIPAEHLTRVFDPFFTTKPEGEGTGLGLSVSYGIVAAHGGRMEVESVVGRGTTFSVVLPVERPSCLAKGE